MGARRNLEFVRTVQIRTVHTSGIRVLKLGRFREGVARKYGPDRDVRSRSEKFGISDSRDPDLCVPGSSSVNLSVRDRRSRLKTRCSIRRTFCPGHPVQRAIRDDIILRYLSLAASTNPILRTVCVCTNGTCGLRSPPPHALLLQLLS